MASTFRTPCKHKRTICCKGYDILQAIGRRHRVARPSKETRHAPHQSGRRTNPPAAVAPQLAAVRAKLGKVPNLIATLAQSPAALATYLAVTGAVAQGTLSAKDRERIALAVGEANSCDYCLLIQTELDFPEAPALAA
jgi:hypothetical protein